MLKRLFVARKTYFSKYHIFLDNSGKIMPFLKTKEIAEENCTGLTKLTACSLFHVT